MWTVHQKYQEDNSYRSLVDMMTSMMIKCEFTPSELRQAAVLAAINFESMRARKLHIFNPALEANLNEAHKLLEKANKEQSP